MKVVVTIASLLISQMLFGQDKVFLRGGEYVCEDLRLSFFDGFSQDSLNSDFWRTTYPFPKPYDRFLHHDCEEELQVYRDSNVIVSNGILSLQARREDFRYVDILEKESPCYPGLDSFNIDFDYTSGMIHSQDGVRFGKGRYEISCKLPQGKGFWPAFWLWAIDEIDVFDDVDDNTVADRLNVGTISTASPRPKCGLDDLYTGNLSQGFHIYAAEWHEYGIDFYINSVLVYRIPRYYRLNGDPLLVQCGQYIPIGWYVENSCYPDFDREFPLIANLGITFRHPPNASTVFPQSLEIDYISVYERMPVDDDRNLCGVDIDMPSTFCLGDNVVAEVLVSSWDSSDSISVLSSDIFIDSIINNFIYATVIGADGEGDIIVDYYSQYCPEVQTVQKAFLVGPPDFSLSMSELFGCEFLTVTIVDFISNASDDVVWNVVGGEVVSDLGFGMVIIEVLADNVFIECTLTNQCGSIMRSISYKKECTGDIFRVVSNPVNSVLHLKNYLSQDLELGVLDLNNGTPPATIIVGPGINSVSVATMNPGVYLLFGENAGQPYSERFVKY